MKLLVESLLVFVLTLSAAALIAQGKPAFSELAVIDAATAACAVLWSDAQCGSTGESEMPWRNP